MSFDDDNRDTAIVFRRPATTISIQGHHGEQIQAIELPELALTRAEVSPEWLALRDAEQAQKGLE